ncbi:MAG TPA: agmatinase, partial [Candidatus Tectomicrobia bacterium]
YVDHHDERFALPFTYGGMLPEDSAFEQAQVVILPIPYEQTTTYGTGTKEGPHALIAASRHMELYDEELDYEVYQVGIHTLRELEPTASGPKAMLDRITEVTGELLDHGKFVVGLGGEHTISFGLVRAYAERFPGLSVLQFDAHTDLRDTYQGTPYNHASVLRRISELVPAVQVGIRSLSREEATWVKGHNARLFYASEVVGSPSSATAISAALTDQVYITICLDGFDPSIMPAVGTPEPGGLGWYDVLRIVRRVAETRHIVGFDVVELFPIPGNVAPDFLAAKLVYKVLGYRFKLEKPHPGQRPS